MENVIKAVPAVQTFLIVLKEELSPGDLVFFGANLVRHVGIPARGWWSFRPYTGEGRFVHAPQTGELVRVDLLSERKDYLGARRITDFVELEIVN